jgi:hypothetical protein
MSTAHHSNAINENQLCPKTQIEWPNQEKTEAVQLRINVSVSEN